MLAEEIFLDRAEGAGFDEEQAEFLLHFLAQRGHTHTAAEILWEDETLDEVLQDVFE